MKSITFPTRISIGAVEEYPEELHSHLLLQKEKVDNFEEFFKNSCQKKADDQGILRTL